VKEDGVVYIETSSDAFSIHEITHIRQSLNNGGLQFSTNNQLKNICNVIEGIDSYIKCANAEVEAYQMQYSYDPSSYIGRTHSLQGIDINSVGNIMNEYGYPVYPHIYNGLDYYNTYNMLKCR
jgi:hypothetical protein